MSDNPKRYPFSEAACVAATLCEELRPFCERIEIAGSLRRGKLTVGDIEILFIPKRGERPSGLFDKETYSLADEKIQQWNETIIAKRPSKIGVYTWGPANKLGIHIPSGIPVDLFATSETNWWNALVCRTGGKENNLLITTTAQRQGWSFEAYGSGFRRLNNSDHHQTTSERDVFEFIGLPYKEPWERS